MDHANQIKIYEVENMYDYKKTLKKIGIQAAIVFLAGLAAVYGQSQWYLAIAPLLTGLMNYLKHRDK